MYQVKENAIKAKENYSDNLANIAHQLKTPITTADNMNDLLIKKHVKIDIQENGCAAFMGDMEWTMEALMNLLKNCMEHTPFSIF